jgi:hypothetical protein
VIYPGSSLRDRCIVTCFYLELGRGGLEFGSLVDGRAKLLDGSSQQLLLLLVDLADGEDLFDTIGL